MHMSGLVRFCLAHGCALGTCDGHAPRFMNSGKSCYVAKGENLLKEKPREVISTVRAYEFILGVFQGI